MAFQCVVVTPEQQLLDEKITQAIIPAHDGLLGLLTGRAALLVKLGLGPLRLDLAGGQQKFFLLDGGVAQMKENRLTILTPAATAAEEISYESARAQYAEAAARKPTDPLGQQKREHDLQAARAKEALAKS